MKDSARLPKERIDMGRLEQLILGHSRRGMDMLADLLPADFCADAGRFVLEWPRGRVLLITGFYVDGKGETFGPEAGEEDLRALLDREKPVGLISTERCGRTADGQYINSRGRDIGPHMAPLDSLFLLSDAPTVGIGDGGNEIGMGNLAADITERLGRVPCAVKTDRLIIATVSNWGALGLCAALGQLPGSAELLAAYELCPPSGLIDGITGEATLSEDGFPVEYVVKLQNDLENLA